MATPTQIVRGLSSDRFGELLAACPKTFREELFRRAGIKAKQSTFQLSSSGAKNRERSDKLHAAIAGGLDLGDKLLEEVVRSYLYTRRELLADALEHLGVEHDRGLTDADLSFVESLDDARVAALRAHLAAKHATADVALYLAFMNVPGA